MHSCANEIRVKEQACREAALNAEDETARATYGANGSLA